MALILLLLGLLMKFSVFTDAQVGVCYGKNGDNLPAPADVVKLYQANGITRMRIYAPDAATLTALSRTNIELILDVAHESLESLTYEGNATTWVRENVLRYPSVKFRYITVGNEVDPDPAGTTSWLVKYVHPAMINVHKALVAARLADRIKVSTATYTGLLENTYPPSKAQFKNNARMLNFIRPIITFLKANGSPMLANIYPYFPHVKDPINNNLAFASFTRTTQAYADENNGLSYFNLFDAMYDAHYAAQSRLGGADIEIVVSESGWPSAGGVAAATPGNAGTYYKNLISHVKNSRGTPARPGKPIETYLFAMFDENKKTVGQGETTERHFGVFNPVTRGAKYQLNF